LSASRFVWLNTSFLNPSPTNISVINKCLGEIPHEFGKEAVVSLVLMLCTHMLCLVPRCTSVVYVCQRSVLGSCVDV
jgi:hypothetical protein